MTVATDRRLTLTEYLTYDDGTDTRYELVDGVLVEMGAESTQNTSIATFLLSLFLGVGIPFYRLAMKHVIEVSGSDACSRYPDLMVHSGDSFEAIRNLKEACLKLHEPNPLLVIEVASPGTESSDNYQRDYVQKPREYADRGIPEYWIVDPDRAWVMVGTLTDETYQFQTFQGDTLITSPTFPNLTLTAAQVLNAGQ